MTTRKLALGFAAFALFITACGTAAEELPLNTNPDADPAVSGACLVDEPDCNDTGAMGDEPVDLPPPSDETPTGAVVDGGLTVSEALATDATGILAVGGFLVDDGTTARLCEALAESFPPQCGGASIELASYTTIDPDSLKTEQGVTWTDDHTVVFGEIVDGVLDENAFIDG